MPSTSFPLVSRVAVALPLLAAGGIHLGAAFSHAEIPTSMTFFLAVAATQLGLGASLFTTDRPRRSTLLAVAVSLAVTTVWVVSRTWGLPFGPDAGVPLRVAPIDAAASLAQLGVIVGATFALARPAFTPTERAAPNLVVRGAAAALAGVTAVAGFIPAFGHDHDHDHAVVAGSTSHGDHDLGAVALGDPAGSTDHDSHEDHGAASGDAGGHSHGPDLPPDHGPDLVDPRRVAGQATDGERITVGDGPAALALRDGVLWVANGAEGTVSRLDAETGAPLGEPTMVGRGPAAIEFSADTAWIPNAADGTVSRLDIETGEPIGTPIPVGGLARDIAIGSSEAWVITAVDGLLVRLDLTTGRVIADPEFIGYGPQSITIADGVAWIVNTLDRAVVRLDEATGERIGEPIPVGAGATDVLAAHGAIWISSTTEGTVRRLDPQTGALLAPPTRVDVQPQIGGGPYALAATADAVWVANNDELTVTALDAQTGVVLDDPLFPSNRHAELARGVDLVAGDGDLWLTVHHENVVVRLPALRPAADGALRVAAAS